MDKIFKGVIIMSLFVIAGLIPSYGMTLNNNEGKEMKIIFPKPFAFAIDDLGWNVGNDDGDVDGQGPYRIGLDREMDINDYKCIIEVAKEVGVRVQGLFILSEMDRKNILGEYPSTTWMGEEWDNSKNISQEQIDIMNFVKENAAYLEFGLHGVGHEYWVNGVKKRAEWYSTDDNHPWPEKSIRQHIGLFKEIMSQYGLDEENGQSFPESFVPCAYSFYWNPEGEYSTGSLLSEVGVKYANTLFHYVSELNPPKGPDDGGYDHGVLVVNRINYGNPWYKLASLPTVPIEHQESSIIESHWSNWLAQDNFLQPTVNDEWVEYYRMVQQNNDRYIAKNTEQFSSQWLYKKYTEVIEASLGKVKIDNTNMPDEPYMHNSLGNMVLKVKLGQGEHISKASINEEEIACYFEDEGYGFIYLPKLERDKYMLEYEIGNKPIDSYIYNNGTYNVYSYKSDKIGVLAEVRIYGEQIIEFHGSKAPENISLSNPNVQIVSSNYDDESEKLFLTLKGIDFQGETTGIKISY